MSAKPPTRLAILMADSPMPQTAARYGDYGGLFKALLGAAAQPEPLESLLAISTHDVVGDPEGAYPPLDAIDAILITGSKHNAHDDHPWIVRLVEYTRRALTETTRIRVVGVCFGHQIVARALGATVAPGPNGWEVAVTEVELTERAREFFGLDKLKIQQMHRDIVTDLPRTDPPTLLLARNDACAIQGMLWPGRAVTVQGHPEFTEDVVREILEARRASGVHSEDLYASGIARVALPHDGVAIARGFIKFLRV